MSSRSRERSGFADPVTILSATTAQLAEDAVRVLSSAGELVSFYYNENTTPSFVWAAGGRELVEFDPSYPKEHHGTEPGRVDELLAELGSPFDSDDEDPYDEGSPVAAEVILAYGSAAARAFFR